MAGASLGSPFCDGNQMDGFALAAPPIERQEQEEGEPFCGEGEAFIEK